MKKTKYTDIDLYLYQETLSNGLEVYIIPNKDVNKIQVDFVTKFGSKIIEFIPRGQSEYKKYSSGIAHFLEHKMFEQRKGPHPFEFFNKHGAGYNAFTNTDRTWYYFDCVSNLKENLNFLLDYVQDLYLTDENVEKEKGIILQEAKSGLDNINRVIHENIKQIVFHNNPVKKATIGTLEEIKNITKEELEECYNTFYHPSNMFLVISGNVDPDKVLEIVKKNQEKKKFPKKEPIKIKAYEEKPTIAQKTKKIKWDITIPITSIIYKINLSKVSQFTKLQQDIYLDFIYDTLFSKMSGFVNYLKEKKIAPTGYSSYFHCLWDYGIFSLQAETEKHKQFIKEVKKKVNKFEIKEEDLELFKKTCISKFIVGTDYVGKNSSSVINDITYFGKVHCDYLKVIKNLNYKDFMVFAKGISFKEYGILLIEPNKKK